MSDPPTAQVPKPKMDNTRATVLEDGYKHHVYRATKFGYTVTYSGIEVINATSADTSTAPYTNEQRAKLAIDKLCEAYKLIPEDEPPF